jgi:hypothetical protein
VDFEDVRFAVLGDNRQIRDTGTFAGHPDHARVRQDFEIQDRRIGRGNHGRALLRRDRLLGRQQPRLADEHVERTVGALERFDEGRDRRGVSPLLGHVPALTRAIAFGGAGRRHRRDRTKLDRASDGGRRSLSSGLRRFHLRYE